MAPHDLLRTLPAVDRVLDDPGLSAALGVHGRDSVRDAVRRRLALLRDEIVAGGLTEEAVAERLARLLDEVLDDLAARSSDPYVFVINATGILVHTNLGRAPLARAAREAAWRAASRSLALEVELRSGRRGSRSGPVREILAELFPGRAGFAVTNNAAAVMLALNTFARDREVLISRGELVEIGGSFRVPDILERSGARLREVGTTNRTRVGDYAGAAGERTGAILRVHPSNFRQVGFTESAADGDLAGLADRLGVPYLVDQGSGNLHDLTGLGIPDEPTVGRLLDAGADVVTFSGDKLLGGPQAGLLVGDPARIEALARNPLARALRPDKLILAALVETLRIHRRGRAFHEIPVLRRLAARPEALADRARVLRERLVADGVPADRLDVVSGASLTGGGSSPGGQIPSALLTVEPAGGGAHALAERLRSGSPAVMARVADERLRLDLRTVDEDEDALLLAALRAALAVDGVRR